MAKRSRRGQILHNLQEMLRERGIPPTTTPTPLSSVRRQLSRREQYVDRARELSYRVSLLADQVERHATIACEAVQFLGSCTKDLTLASAPWAREVETRAASSVEQLRQVATRMLTKINADEASLSSEFLLLTNLLPEGPLYREALALATYLK